MLHDWRREAWCEVISSLGQHPNAAVVAEVVMGRGVGAWGGRVLCPWMWVVVRCKQYKMSCRLVTQAAPWSYSPDGSHASMLCKHMPSRGASCEAEPAVQLMP